VDAHKGAKLYRYVPVLLRKAVIRSTFLLVFPAYDRPIFLDLRPGTVSSIHIKIKAMTFICSIGISRTGRQELKFDDYPPVVHTTRPFRI